MSYFFLKVPRVFKKLTFFLLDIIAVLLSIWIAFCIRLEENVNIFSKAGEHEPLNAVILSLIIFPPIFYFLGRYNTLFRYTNLNEILQILWTSAYFALLFGGIIIFVGVEGVPRSIGVLQPILFFLLISLNRILPQKILDIVHLNLNSDVSKSNIVIYGAGKTGIELSNLLSKQTDFNFIAFIDDDAAVAKTKINGKFVWHTSDLPELLKSFCVNHVLLAIPSLSTKRRDQIIANLAEYNLNVSSMPSLLKQIGLNFGDVSSLNFSLDQLLEREAVRPNIELMKKDINGKKVLITGAGGSIGSELCLQVLSQNPSELIVMDFSEFNLYEIVKILEVTKSVSNSVCEITPILGNVTDRILLFERFEKYRPDTVYHAAAYKHVPLVESNPFEGVYNNSFGTLNVVEASIEFGVRKFVLISSDKAVRPTNIMGASKRLAELIVQSKIHELNSTDFAVVRFGNVIGSSGSVIPLFHDQIKSGGPVTVTSKEVTRYFMTITEAASLVIQAGAMENEKQCFHKDHVIYLLDMGKPVKIYDLAKKMIEMSGKKLSGEARDGIEIKIIGLRPGEKLFEELLISAQSGKTNHEKIFVSKERHAQSEEVEKILKHILLAKNNNDVKKLQEILENPCIGYTKS